MKFVALTLLATAVAVSASLDLPAGEPHNLARRHQKHGDRVARSHRRKVKRGCKAPDGTITSAAAAVTTSWSPTSTWDAPVALSSSATWAAAPSAENWQAAAAEYSSSSSPAWSSSQEWTSSSSAAEAEVTANAKFANADSSSSSSSSNTNTLSAAGITSFTGNNTGIGSWFRTNSGTDSTNGMSWCQTHYQDSWMGFAPSVDTMLANFGYDTTTAATAYCGREAIATNPNTGATATIYIVDGFASEWVRTPGSIDLTVAAFTALYGSSTDNKDNVIQNLEWRLTGNVKQEYTYGYGK